MTKLQAFFIVVFGEALVTGLDQSLEVGKIVFIVRFGDEDDLVENPSIFDKVSLAVYISIERPTSS